MISSISGQEISELGDVPTIVLIRSYVINDSNIFLPELHLASETFWTFDRFDGVSFDH